MNKTAVLRIFPLLVVLAGVLAGCGGSSAGQQGGTQTIAVSGAFALYPMMVAWAGEYQKLHPDVRIDVSAGGAGKGMADTLAGAVDIGMVSRSVTDDEKQKGAYPISVARDAVFGVVNAKNPVLEDLLKMGITPEAYHKIYITGEYTTWGQVVNRPEITDEIHVYTRSDSSGAGDVWAKFTGGKAQTDLKGIGVNGDPGLLDAVIKDPLGIGYNNLGYAFDLTTGKTPADAVVVPIDANKNGKADPDEIIADKDTAASAIINGKYPTPPARTEFLVTRGEPSGVVRDFIRWILADGQKLLAPAGYVPLQGDQLAAEQAKVK